MPTDEERRRIRELLERAGALYPQVWLANGMPPGTKPQPGPIVQAPRSGSSREGEIEAERDTWKRRAHFLEGRLGTTERELSQALTRNVQITGRVVQLEAALRVASAGPPVPPLSRPRR